MYMVQDSSSVRMTSGPFLNTYQLYKKQTDKLAKWLLEKAEQCGYKVDDLQASRGTERNAPSSGRLKGNARKEARLKKESSAVQPPSAEGATFRIRLAQFIELARVIANAGVKKIIVPHTFVKLVKDTVGLRRKYALFYEAQGGNLMEANSKHMYFIETLEEVLRILRPQSVPLAKKVSQPSTKETGATELDGELGNRFGALELEEFAGLDETSKTELDGPEAELEDPTEPDLNDDQSHTSDPVGKKNKQVNVKETPRKVVYEAESDDEELCFVMFCLFEDMHLVRKYLQITWKDYKSGKIDLENASVVTNTAFDMVRRANEEFCQLYPDLDAKPFNLSYYLIVCMLRGIDGRYAHQPGDWFNYDMVKIAEWLYLPTYSLLVSFCSVIKPRSMPQFKQGHFGVYNPTDDRASMPLRQRYQEDKIILMELLPEFCLLGQSKVKLWCADEMSRGLGNMYVTKQVPVWLSFATQIFLDINHALREHVGDGWRKLEAAGLAAKSSMKFTINASRHTKGELWNKSNAEQVLQESVSYIDAWITNDQIDRTRRLSFGSSYADGGVVEPYYLLTRHPLLCGVMKFSITLMTREIGLTLATTHGSISYVAHLYNALRQSSTLDVLWPDMDFFVLLNTPEKVFAGNLPTSLQDCWKRYNLMMGAAPQVFARHQRAGGRGQVPYAKKGARDWVFTPPIVDTFRERYLLKGSVMGTVHSIEAILNKEGLLPIPESLSNWDRPDNRDIVQLLASLRHTFIREGPGLNFDYASMHYRCLDLLRTLDTELHGTLLKRFGPHYIDGEHQLSSLVGYLILQAVETENIAESIRELKREKTGSSMFFQVASVMKLVIETEGDREVLKVAPWSDAIKDLENQSIYI